MRGTSEVHGIAWCLVCEMRYLAWIRSKADWILDDGVLKESILLW